MSSHFAKEQTQERLEKVIHCLKRVHEGTEEEDVHDLRVSIRRFKAALRIFGPEFERRAARKIRDKLDAVMQAAGTVRDRDVVVKLAVKSVSANSEIVGALRKQRDDGAHKLKSRAGKLLGKDPAEKWPKRLGL